VNIKLPDVTPAQVGALLVFLLSQVTAWSGWVGSPTGQLVIAIGGIAIAGVWKLADAFLRGKRVTALAAKVGLNNPLVMNVVKSEIEPLIAKEIEKILAARQATSSST
jgi:hypothetical protein